MENKPMENQKPTVSAPAVNNELENVLDGMRRLEISCDSSETKLRNDITALRKEVVQKTDEMRCVLSNLEDKIDKNNKIISNQETKMHQMSVYLNTKLENNWNSFAKERDEIGKRFGNVSRRVQNIEEKTVSTVQGIGDLEKEINSLKKSEKEINSPKESEENWFFNGFSALADYIYGFVVVLQCDNSYVPKIGVLGAGLICLYGIIASLMCQVNVVNSDWVSPCIERFKSEESNSLGSCVGRGASCVCVRYEDC